MHFVFSPFIARPEITKTIVCLKDCHSLEVETAWRLENKPALPLSKFFVHVFKNNIKVHTTEVLAVRNKAEFSIKFFVPEVIEHETGAMYEVCVEAEREHDSMTIPSNRMKAPNPERRKPSSTFFLVILYAAFSQKSSSHETFCFVFQIFLA